jgi:hypothetical protein
VQYSTQRALATSTAHAFKQNPELGRYLNSRNWRSWNLSHALRAAKLHDWSKRIQQIQLSKRIKKNETTSVIFVRSPAFHHRPWQTHTDTITQHSRVEKQLPSLEQTSSSFTVTQYSSYCIVATISVVQRAQTRKQQGASKASAGLPHPPHSFPQPRVERPRRRVVRLKKRVEISVHVGSGHAKMDADARGDTCRSRAAS